MIDTQDKLGQTSLSGLHRYLASRGLLEFTQATFDGYHTNWHHEVMAEALERWANPDNPLDRLIILMPPRHGKSELVSRRLPAFILGRQPNANIIATSYSSRLASRMNRDVQRIIDSRRYHDIFPNIILPRSQTSDIGQAGFVRTSTMFELVGYEGRYISAGVGGGITGMGGDYIVIDDPVKNMEEAMSQTIRDKVWEWYNSTLYTRLESGGKILLTMTRWHSDDLAGRLIQRAKEDEEADQWEIVSFPAVATEAEEHREAGEALWSWKKNDKDLQRIKASVTSKVWSSLYQQNPTPDEGAIWKRGYIIPIKRDEIPERLDRHGTDWDLAYTSKDHNSASAYVTSGQFNNNIYITGLGAVWKEFPELIQFMKNIGGSHFVEDKASGKSAVQTLRREGITATLVEVNGDKIARTRDVTPHGEAGRIYVAAELHDYLFNDPKQGLIHLSTENPDIDLNDALTQAIKRHLGGALSDWRLAVDDKDMRKKRNRL